MKKNLRYVFVALLAVVGFGNAMAEDVIWSEDFSSYAKDDVPAGCADGASATKVYYENLAGGTAPELLIGKKSADKDGGSYTVTINLNGKSGAMFLQYKANYDRIEVSGTSVTIGEKEVSGKSYTYPLTVAAGTSSITLTFANTTTSNVRFDDAKVYQGTAKKPAGLNWGTASRSVTIGADDNQFPELQNDNNLPVTYSSSETGVATIDASGNITLIAAGSTVISAAFAGNDEYEAQTVTYTLTVKEQGGTTPDDPTEVQQVTVAQALDIINGLEDGKTTSEKYRVKGYVVGTPDFQRRDDGSLYGNVNFDMADTKGGTTTLTVFRAKDFDGANFTEDTIDRIKADDEVVVEGKLQKYVKDGVTTPEIATGGILISVNGQATGISAIAAEANTNAPAYNVAGQRVNQGYKGLVIKGGKKYVVK